MKRFNVRSRIGRRISIFVALTMIITTISSLGAGMIGFAFTDTTGHWAESVIDTWSERGVINGYEDGTFMPDANITRAEFTKVIASAGGFTTYSELSFSDVAGDEWFAQYLRGCVAAGVVSGYDDGTFRPDAYITREEAVVMIDRAYGIEGYGSLLPFSDVGDISDWAVSSVAACVGAGIVNGYEDGTFMPAAYVTRAEVVKMIDSADGYTPSTENNNGNSTSASGGSSGLSWAGSGGGSWGGGSTGGGSSTSSTARITFNANGGVFSDDSETTTVTV